MQHEEAAPEIKTEAPKEEQASTLPTTPVVIYPMSGMNQTLQYSVMYQPVFVSHEDPNIYLAGPLLTAVPNQSQEKGFLSSLGETLSIAGRGIVNTVTPVVQKVGDAVTPVVHKVGEKLQPVGQKITETLQPIGNKIDAGIHTAGEKIQEGYNNWTAPTPAPAAAAPTPAQEANEPLLPKEN